MGVAGLICSISLIANAQFCSWNTPTIEAGNHEVAGGYGVGEDFKVIHSVEVSALGFFDDRGDGVKGQAAIIVHLYASNPDRARKNDSGVMLETIVFDAANPGQLIDGFRFKPLTKPVRLLPGEYTITAAGFDSQNLVFKMPEADLNKGKTAPARVILNDGGGLIQFEGADQYHVGNFLKRTRTAKNIFAIEHRPDRYAAASFVYSKAQATTSPYALDYSVLTAGVKDFPLDSPTNRPNLYSYHYGSIALLNGNSFPVLMEPSGDRLILEAAGLYGGDRNAARCVAFAHQQWGHSFGDARIDLFENAVHWAAGRLQSTNIILGVSTNLNTTYFANRGYRVAAIDSNGSAINGMPLSQCNVMVVDFDMPCSEQFLTQVAQFIANGGNVVAIFVPWKCVTSGNRQKVDEINTLLQPFGIAYRYSLTQPCDDDFTNVQLEPYPPMLFNAFQAAALLGQDRLGQIQLDSLQRAIAHNTVAYAADGQPDLMAALASIYSGSSNNVIGALTGHLGSFEDQVVLAGSQANTNYLGAWEADDSDLVSKGTRGSMEYDFNVQAANVYRIQVFGTESPIQTNEINPDILVSIDGIPLGHYDFQEPYGSDTLSALFASQSSGDDATMNYGASDHINALTPYLKAGPHNLRIFWNNHNIWAQLRLKSIHVQSAVGADSDGDGVVDWVRGLIESQSGLDSTNSNLVSYISPACVEGRAPFLSLLNMDVSGNGKSASYLIPSPEPDNRWYVNVPLPISGSALLHVTYQNGVKSEMRQVQWLPVNILDGGKYTIRDGDSLLLVARPDENVADTQGTVQITVGTNQFNLAASSSKPYAFTGSGTFRVTGTYTSPNGIPQTGSITVEVVQQKFTDNPDCHVGEERIWNVSVPPEATLQTVQGLHIGQLLKGESQTTLTLDQSEPRYIISRIGTNGPVLCSWKVDGFDFWEGLDTYLRVIKTYSDGTQLMEMMVVADPVLPDITAQINILVGGVVFDDGTTTKNLDRADFDSLGRCYVRFLHAPTSESAVCHSVLLLQGNSTVGRIW